MFNLNKGFIFIKKYDNKTQTKKNYDFEIDTGIIGFRIVPIKYLFKTTKELNKYYNIKKLENIYKKLYIKNDISDKDVMLFNFFAQIKYIIKTPQKKEYLLLVNVKDWMFEIIIPNIKKNIRKNDWIIGYSKMENIKPDYKKIILLN